MSLGSDPNDTSGTNNTFWTPSFAGATVIFFARRAAEGKHPAPTRADEQENRPNSSYASDSPSEAAEQIDGLQPVGSNRSNREMVKAN